MFTKKNVRAAQKKCEKNYSQFVGFLINIFLTYNIYALQ